MSGTLVDVAAPGAWRVQSSPDGTHAEEICIRKASKLLKKKQRHKVPPGVSRRNNAVVHIALVLVGRVIVNEDFSRCAGGWRRRSKSVDVAPYAVAVPQTLPQRPLELAARRTGRCRCCGHRAACARRRQRARGHGRTPSKARTGRALGNNAWLCARRIWRSHHRRSSHARRCRRAAETK
jgi:hypothetical protein